MPRTAPRAISAAPSSGRSGQRRFVVPLRLAALIKLVDKNSKGVTGIWVVTTLKADRKVFWEDQGCEWFVGL